MTLQPQLSFALVVSILITIPACSKRAAPSPSSQSAAVPDSDVVVELDTNLPGVANSAVNAIALTPWARAHGAPAFGDYPAGEVYHGRPALVDLRSAPGARQYRTVLTKNARRGANFAGRYTIVEWGCGSPCVQFAIIDAPTGRILLYQPDSTYTRSPMYRLDSRLLVEDPTGAVTDTAGHLEGVVTYYQWTGLELRPVHTLNVDHVRLDQP
jgi:hypothetical protein